MSETIITTAPQQPESSAEQTPSASRPVPQVTAEQRTLTAGLCPWWTQLSAVEQQHVLEDVAGADMDPAEYWDDPMPKDEHLETVRDQRKQWGWPTVEQTASSPAAETSAPSPVTEQPKAAQEYAPLVERDTATEAWQVCPGIEDDAKSLFREASTSEPPMPVRTLGRRVASLDAKAKAIKAEELARAAADPKAGKAAKDKADRAQQQADKAAEKVASHSQPADKPQATTIQAPNAPTPPCQAPVTPLRDMAKAGTARDVAEMAAELITGCDTPDDCLEQLFRTLKDSTALGNKAKRALDAAIVVLSRTDRPGPSPVQVAGALSEHKPSANGAVTAAVA
jgi:hypothetical protein